MMPGPKKELDILRLKGMVFHARHGSLKAERELDQRFEVDLEIMGDFRKAAESDSLKEAVDYRALHQAVKKIMEGPSKHLLESLAESIAKELLTLKLFEGVTVRVCKPHVPYNGIMNGAEVEITRWRHPPSSFPPVTGGKKRGEDS
jgi:dihydroneopterin aldolase